MARRSKSRRDREYALLVQGLLNNAGFNLDLTGENDAATQGAIATVQRLSGLPQTGLSDEATEKAIRAYQPSTGGGRGAPVPAPPVPPPTNVARGAPAPARPVRQPPPPITSGPQTRPTPVHPYWEQRAPKAPPGPPLPEIDPATDRVPSEAEIDAFWRERNRVSDEWWSGVMAGTTDASSPNPAETMRGPWFQRRQDLSGANSPLAADESYATSPDAAPGITVQPINNLSRDMSQGQFDARFDPPPGRPPYRAGMEPSEPPPGSTQGELLFLDKLGQTWPARLGRELWRGFTLPHDVATGDVPLWDPSTGHISQDVIERSADLGTIAAGTHTPPARVPVTLAPTELPPLYHGTAGELQGGKLALPPERTLPKDATIRQILDTAPDIGNEYGPGIHVTSVPSQADRYAARAAQVSGKPAVRLDIGVEANRNQFINWDWPVTRRYQPPEVMNTLERYYGAQGKKVPASAAKIVDDPKAMAALKDSNIAGVHYRDKSIGWPWEIAQSYGRSNYTVWNPEKVSVKGMPTEAPLPEPAVAPVRSAAESRRMVNDAVATLKSEAAINTPEQTARAVDASRKLIDDAVKTLRDEASGAGADQAALDKINDAVATLKQEAADQNLAKIDDAVKTLKEEAAAASVDPAAPSLKKVDDAVKALKALSVEEPGAVGASEATGGEGSKIVLYHGSPHIFDRFDSSKINTGEGAQAYGHGLYFAENPAVADFYRKALQGHELFVDGVAVTKDTPMARAASGIAAQGYDGALKTLDVAHRHLGLYTDAETAAQLDALNAIKDAKIEWRPTGKTYEVSIRAEPDRIIEYDKPFSEQSAAVQKALRDTGIVRDSDLADKAPLSETAFFGPQQSAAMRAAGIKGLRYLDQKSRARGRGTYDYVIFDDSIVSINGKP